MEPSPLAAADRNPVAIIATRSILRDGLCSLIGEMRPAAPIVVHDDATSLLREHEGGPLFLVLFDLRHAVLDALQQIAQLKSHLSSVRVLVIAFSRDAESIADALRAGADGYLLSDDRPEELRYAINTVAQGGRHLSSSICHIVIDGFLRAAPVSPSAQDAAPKLSERERQVLRMIAGGMRTREIAAHLNLSPKTVEKHRGTLMRKLGLASAPAVAAYAITHGYVTL